MFFIYGAHNSKACDRAEFLLHTMGQEYRFYCYGIDYTLTQLQRLVPGTQTVPHIFHGTKYIGGVNEIYKYLQKSEDSDGGGTTGTVQNKRLFNIFSENQSNISNDTTKE